WRGLFGTYLGVSDAQVLTLLGVGAAALLALAVIARPLFFASLDPDVARARGVPEAGVHVVPRAARVRRSRGE
ncbi:MAG TPA: metal ABC transporter permease, partial [Acidimicrobiales bacterium]|nr:metal ABC transporter permease [Acidimicrobiales bacterium]